ncbi:MAG: undecaprenyldiphospho-muramoylpentapeptide beta-N-acetylglucosaminyltransferase [Micavibrio sp.]|nr:MAG: undecaprenyldiphospho-muramoylpentapeptide beta-N-acetylglucosaminyltransferase [Micavibrio sp.]
MEKTDHIPQKILLSAGGTGGHLFPAQALATELLKNGDIVSFATDSRGMVFHEKSDWPQKNRVAIHTLPSAPMKPGLFGKISALLVMGLGVLKALLLLYRTKPGCVVGFGGYPSFPAVYAAQLLKIPTILHEQNAVLGKANARLAKKARKIATSLPDTQGIIHYARKTVMTGNPVRAEILAQQGAEMPPVSEDESLNIFVMGGSQGARIFGEVIPKAVKLLPEDLQQRLSIRQQCRPEDIDAVQKRFEDTSASADVRPFFNDVAKHLVRCHLFIGRAGASTVAEVAVVGRPAIFVPLKHADEQQLRNAEAIADAGGGWVMNEDEFTAKALAELLKEIFTHPEVLTAAAEASKSAGRPGATGRLAGLIYKILGLAEGQSAPAEKQKTEKEDAA